MELPSSRQAKKVIVLDTSQDDLEHITKVISEQIDQTEVYKTSDSSEFRKAINDKAFDLVIIEKALSDYDAISLIHEVRLKDWDAAIVVVSKESDARNVIESYNAGCHRCLVKEDRWLSELGPSIRQALRLRYLQQEQNRLVAKLTEANALLSEKNKRLDEFSGTVAHDIRGPLGGISMKLEYIKDIYGDDLDQKFKGIVDGTLDSTRRLIGVVQAMYEYAKLSNKITKTEEIELNSFIEEILNDLSFNESLDIQVGIAELPIVYGSSGLLRKVFQNLITNAVKYNDKPTKIINISCDKIIEKSMGAFAEIHVADNGPGIPENEHQLVFNMFARGSNVNNQDGIGIGLAVVKRIIELHYGNIEIKSELGKGTTFIFTLPIDQIDLSQ
jgi:signal transduction histidine kinase